ncbi:MAG: hypothetical protein MJZ30_09535 [Paludibacteraceae bacterium]|nr:hypothetical protein [Paludibacteraceae bacterium]
MEVKSKITPIKVYRGGKRLVDYCKYNNIRNRRGLDLFNSDTLFYIEDSEINGAMKPGGPFASALLERGFVVEEPIAPWRADRGLEFWHITQNLSVTTKEDNRTKIDDELYYSGNYFSTKSEAEKKAEIIKRVLVEI